MPKLGRPRKIFDESKIIELVSKGFTNEYVADYFGCHVDTLYSNYSDALRKGKVSRNSCLQAKQLENAMAGNPTLLIWLGKQWLEQTDKTEMKQTIQHDFADLTKLTDSELQQVRSIIDSAERAI
jgi:hypothetical protein